MAAVTSSRVSKGTSKFVPKAKPRATRRAEQTRSLQKSTDTEKTKERQGDGDEDDEQQQQHEGDERESQDIEAVRQQHEDSEETQDSDYHRVPEPQPSQTRAIAPGATAIGIPIIASSSFTQIGIPTVDSTMPHRMRTTAAEPANIAATAAADGVVQSPKRVPPRLNIHSYQPLPAASGSGASVSAASLPRLASLSSPISPQSTSANRAKRAPRSRVTSPLKRPRTASKTPEPRPILQLKTEDDYSCLAAEEISNLPMAYFCRDTRHGRPTAEFIEKENEFIRKINAHTEGKNPDLVKEATPAPEPEPVKKTEPTAQPVNRMAAQVRIVDGKVVVDAESLMINRSDMAGTSDEPLELIDESTRQRFTNSLTYVPKRTSRKRWKTEETELFYDALRKYGTDFQTIASVLPGRNRYDIRNKFKAEEKNHASRITVTLLRRDCPVPSPRPDSALPEDAYLADGLPVSLESYSMVTTPNPDSGAQQQQRDSETEGHDDEPLPEPSAVIENRAQTAPRTRSASMNKAKAAATG
ncbi:hypothetical protein LPJ57_000787 [Coemansia sp. RSA 486]|nr:hypothetical protein LPJ57_000787 [Coemansia sp. RSA 486]KAJ2600599.1 hypothetical protein GGF39_001678 [Coemansia sp. RSA 1721]KAJ2640323.1 hypothetical protein GGF40_000222 [Coemansia sp. RSA 1286]